MLAGLGARETETIEMFEARLQFVRGTFEQIARESENGEKAKRPFEGGVVAQWDLVSRRN